MLYLIRAIGVFRATYGVDGHNVRALRAVALLHCTYTQRGEQRNDDIRLLTNLEETDTEASHEHSDLWNIAVAISQQPTPRAAWYLSHVRDWDLEGAPKRAGVLSWILWSHFPVSARLAALDTVLPQWRTEYVGEVHQAAIMSQDLQPLQAVVRHTILPPDDTDLGSMDSIEPILLRYVSHFVESTKSIILLWESLILRCPHLITAVVELGGNMIAPGGFCYEPPN